MHKIISNPTVDEVMVLINTKVGRRLSSSIEGFDTISGPLKFTGQIREVKGGSWEGIEVQTKGLLFKHWVYVGRIVWEDHKVVKTYNIKDHPENLI